MDIYKTCAALFYLMIMADGRIDKKESSMGDNMIRCEGYDKDLFYRAVNAASAKNRDELYDDCVAALKTLDQSDQERLLAWMCLIANADGFMDNKEWSFLYQIYHRELNLERASIFRMQRTIRSSMYQVKTAPSDS